MGQAQYGRDQDVEHLLLDLDVVVEEPVLEAEPRVVDQQVDGAVGIGDARLDGGELLAVGEVGHHHLDVHAVLASELGSHLLQAIAVAGDQDEVVATGGELLGEGQADARGGAGDQGRSSRHAPSIPRTVRVSGDALGQNAGMSTVLAIANQKGGVAKTTTVASLGAALAERGQRVLLVDLDPQACLTFSLGIDPEDLELSVHHVLTKGLDPTEVIVTTEEGIDLLPATIELARAEADLLTRTGREYVIRGAIDELPEYDWVLLDCPPSLGVLTVAALTAATGVLIPLQCETLSHRGVGQLLDTVHDVRRFTNRGLQVWGVLPTLFDGRTNHARAVLDNISEAYSLDVVEPPIPKSIRFAEAPAAGQSILTTTRKHRGADAYREVAGNLMARQKAGSAS